MFKEYQLQCYDARDHSRTAELLNERSMRTTIVFITDSHLSATATCIKYYPDMQNWCGMALVRARIIVNVTVNATSFRLCERVREIIATRLRATRDLRCLLLLSINFKFSSCRQTRCPWHSSKWLALSSCIVAFECQSCCCSSFLFSRKTQAGARTYPDFSGCLEITRRAITH